MYRDILGTDNGQKNTEGSTKNLRYVQRYTCTFKFALMVTLN